MTAGQLGGLLYSGGHSQSIPISFVNPYNVPITITSIQVSFTNSFPTGCSANTFQVEGGAATGSPPSATFTPTPALILGAASKGTPATTPYNGTEVALSDDGTNQVACEGLNLSFAVTARGVFATTGCIAGSQNGLTVASGQVACISSGGKVTNGINIKSGGVLLVNGGSVTGGIKASSPAGVSFCNASISGGVSITGATGEVVIGDGQSCAGSTIGNGLTVSSNMAGIQLIGNSVSGGTTINSNTGSVPFGSGPGTIFGQQFVMGNTFAGGLACSGNNPALTDGAEPNSVTSGTRSGSQCSGSF